MHHEMLSRNLDKNPDEVRKFTNGKVELANLGESTIGRVILEPDWKWSKDVKPIANTNSCQFAHTQYAISGRIRVRMDDGWVVGNEPFVAVDFTGMKEYATTSNSKE